jgi:hypothetical protein
MCVKSYDTVGAGKLMQELQKPSAQEELEYEVPLLHSGLLKYCLESIPLQPFLYTSSDLPGLSYTHC